MIIYGVALLAFCMLAGVFVGDLIGSFIGVQANVGGIGIAMLLLIYLSNLGNKKLQFGPLTESGIHFWSAMYIPIVVAMAAKQNVIGALSGGWMALLAGVGAVVVSFLLIPVLAHFTPAAERGNSNAD
ncbi:malonate transporter subunit MadL [SAR92 clade bacterium H921]|jgi:malonate transporter MadL subunit|nr:malonate transporter subunit MadL [SAR92 clade bacterium H921]MDG1307771.1 malonate transporter subunit MadL [Porticoccaceae bacterium]